MENDRRRSGPHTAEVEELFARAMERPPGERAAFVESAASGNDALRREVESLLGYHDRGERALESPPLRIADEVDAALRLEGGDEPSHPVSIGPYRIERSLGSGGMGQVYLARRDAGAAPVAVKVLLPGVPGRALAERFERERQALASLRHTGIATLLDSGKTPEGLPYLVMEFVDGESITDFCDRRRLTVRERIGLFRRVCDAVQYAHRNLVLHRDLKPSNILITRDGSPKLLDFGIAKILDAGTSIEEATLTSPSQRVLTPEYASPEQFRGDRVSTQTDVYSLGVLLYVILTGRRPYALGGMTRSEMLRTVCEREPPRPSEAVGLGSGGAVAARTVPGRHESVGEAEWGREALRRLLAGDLDMIVMMALRKEPERRFPSVEALSEDLRRHLVHLPILARKGTLRYRAQKFVKRNRAAAAAALVLLVAAAATLVGVSREARLLRQREASLRARAFVDEILSIPPLDPGTRDEIRAAVARRAGGLLSTLDGQESESLAFARSVAAACEMRFLDDLAVEWRERALEAAGLTTGADPALHLYEAGRSYHRALRFERAEARLAAALDRARSGRSAISESDVLHEIGRVHRSAGDFERARSSLEAGLDALRAGRGARDGEAEVAALLDLAGALEDLGDPERAESLLRDGLGLANGVEGPAGTALRGLVHHRLGSLLWASPRFREAHPHVRRAVADLRSGVSADDPRLATAANDLAFFLRLSERLSYDTASSAVWREAFDLRTRLFGEKSLAVAESYHTLSLSHSGPDAAWAHDKALDFFRDLLPARHPRLVDPLARLGETLTGLEAPELDRAERLLTEALEISRARYGPAHWRSARVEALLGWNLGLQGRSGESVTLITKGLGRLDECLGKDHPWVGSLAHRSIPALKRAGRPELAVPLSERWTAGRWIWPFSTTHRDDDNSMEAAADLDFEDDLAEKTVLVPDWNHEGSRVRLWIYGKPYNNFGGGFRNLEDHLIEVNEGGEKTLRFDVRAAFVVAEAFQWTSFEIPAAWIVRGENVFRIREDHRPDWRETRPWEFNNLLLGIDLDRDDDRSWWIAGNRPCCPELANETMRAEKPLASSSPLLAGHRDRGLRECRGELMMFLEIY